MTYQTEFTLLEVVLEHLASQGLDGLPDLLRMVSNAATHPERGQHIGAGAEGRMPW